MSEFTNRLEDQFGGQRGWKKKLSDYTGIPATTISSWKSSNPSFEHLQKIGKYFDINYLLTGNFRKTEIPKKLLKICEVLDSLEREDLDKAIEYAEMLYSKREANRKRGRVAMKSDRLNGGKQGKSPFPPRYWISLSPTGWTVYGSRRETLSGAMMMGRGMVRPG